MDRQEFIEAFIEGMDALKDTLDHYKDDALEGKLGELYVHATIEAELWASVKDHLLPLLTRHETHQAIHIMLRSGITVQPPHTNN